MVILDGEDDFVNMLRHVLGVLGMTSDASSATRTTRRARSTAYDLVIVGPGPGRPARRRRTRRSRRSGAAVDDLLARAAVPRGLPGPPGAVRPARHRRWPTRTSSSRAPSRRSTIDGRDERVGFYNTFVGRVGDGDAARRASRSRPTRRPATSTWSRGPHYRGIQFHAESILTEHGYDLLHDLVLDLLAMTRPGG